MTTTEFNIEALPVTIAYVGETVRDNDWKCDQWRVQLTSKAGFWSTDYFTGVGLRGPRTERVSDGGPELRKGTLMWERLEASRKPQKPAIADVMHSLFMDASAADNSFHDWCAEYGYSDDSIKALNTYKQCLDIATALRKHLSPEQRKAVEAIVSEM